jgi:quinol monooxygenase YgiN
MVSLVNTFDVHGPVEDFERVFAALSECMGAQAGFRRHTLLRYAGESASYVNIAEWDDEHALRSALGRRQFLRHAGPLARLATARPRLCLPVLGRSATGV